ncbi:hypothetical protein IDH01_01035 [Pelagibacterales bacterium SAG-MED08]|nr:hypothetical protein [Pelagibacterales bacterium SAG-MED08]|tara:strand:- start:456 stop:1406 length:951 start_codon:yes stop_codon:yes gene_type:complete
MSKKVNFFGLLHLKHNENLILNFKSKNEEEKHLVYLKNAIVLNEQLKNFGYTFHLITNNKKYLKKKLENLGYHIKLVEINFETYVPPNTHFYACHYRVDIFRYLSSLKNSYSILIDLDVLIFKKARRLEKIKNSNIAFVNDITQNVLPAYGRENILNKLKLLNPKLSKVKWYGGDFFCGNSDFYKLLFKRTKIYQKKFVKNISNLKDQTDELFVSLAITDIKEKYKIIKCENNNFFTRYWNANIKHEQKHLSYYTKFAFLHIPADKLFLSKCYNKIRNKKNFKNLYVSHVRGIRNNFRLILSKIKIMFLINFVGSK